MTHSGPSSHEEPKYWTEELVSGNPVIDQQHIELIRRFEMLESSIAREQGYKEVKGLVTFMQRYVLTHFNTEEQDMLACAYPRLKEHVEQHDICKKRIFQFKKFVETETDKNKVLNVALSMIGLWVKDHILQHDLDYIHYAKEKVKTKKSINVDYHWSPRTSELWESDFAVGVKTIDEQHQKIVKWTEYLLTREMISPMEFQKIFDFIQGFIYTHFTDEELFLIDIDYPGLQEHTDLHCEVRNQFTQVQSQFDSGKNERDIVPTVIQLFKSYVCHIKQHDMQYIAFHNNMA